MMFDFRRFDAQIILHVDTVVLQRVFCCCFC